VNVLLPSNGRSAHGAHSTIHVTNRLLAGLSVKDLARLRRHLEPVTLTHRLILSRPDTLIEHVYFPERGMVSLLQTLSDGAQIEVGVTGKEGFVGVAVLLGATTSPIEAMVQIPGSGFRMSAAALREQMQLSKSRSALLQRYAFALQISSGCSQRALAPTATSCRSTTRFLP
jgi:CRP-like cAMP-binding protein